jgi:hypothetical protein
MRYHGHREVLGEIRGGVESAARAQALREPFRLGFDE